MSECSPACYGVECSLHHNCKRYAMVDGAKAWQSFIGHCLDGEGGRPLYLPIVTSKETNAS